MALPGRVHEMEVVSAANADVPGPAPPALPGGRTALALRVPGSIDSIPSNAPYLISPRPGSDAGASIATRLRLHERIAATTPTRSGANSVGALAVQKAAQESMMQNVVKRHMDSLEDKVESQMARVQEHGDRLREAAFSRLDGKVSSAEAMQLKFDRKLAELSGNYKGLSEETQCQIRRLDNIDAKLWDWRHQVDEETRSKFTEVDQHVQKLHATVSLNRATSEEAVGRLWTRMRRLENFMEERLGETEETTLNLANLDSRLQEIEAARLQDLTLALPSQRDVTEDQGPTLGSDHLITLEAKVAESLRKLEQTARDMEEFHTRLEAQEVRLSNLRVVLDSKEESYRSVKLDRQDWESKTKELQQLTAELERQRLAQHERLEIFENKLVSQDKVCEEVRTDVVKLQDRKFLELEALRSEASPKDDDEGTQMSLLALDNSVEACLDRLRSAEERIRSLADEVAKKGEDSDLAPRVTALVDMLSGVAPRVLEQENSVNQLIEKVGYLEGKVTAASDQGKESVIHRIGNLEVIVGRLKMELEGVEANGNGARD